MMIDVQVAFGLNGNIHARMPRKQVEHVIEKADASRDRRAASSVEINFDLDVGFLGLSLYGALAHANILCWRAFYQGFSGFATCVANGLQIRITMPR
jgi:hypothetical protein